MSSKLVGNVHVQQFLITGTTNPQSEKAVALTFEEGGAKREKIELKNEHLSFSWCRSRLVWHRSRLTFIQQLCRCRQAQGSDSMVGVHIDIDIEFDLFLNHYRVDVQNQVN